jgi:hypothetical protein
MATEHFVSVQKVSFFYLQPTHTDFEITLKRNRFISIMVQSTIYFANIGSIKWFNNAAA